MARIAFDAGIRANSPRHQSLWRSLARALTARLICRADRRGTLPLLPVAWSQRVGEAASRAHGDGLRPRYGARWRPSLRLPSVWRLIGTRLTPAAADARGLTVGTRSRALKCEAAMRLSQLQPSGVARS
jgi:hypothetical protein